MAVAVPPEETISWPKLRIVLIVAPADPNDAVAIRGPGAAALTVRREPTAPASQVFVLLGRATLSGFTISGGDGGPGSGAALDAVGLAFMLEAHAAPHLANGTLVRVLEDWCPPFASYFLYYPSRRQQPAALSALIDTLRL